MSKIRREIWFVIMLVVCAVCFVCALGAFDPSPYNERPERRVEKAVVGTSYAVVAKSMDVRVVTKWVDPDGLTCISMSRKEDGWLQMDGISCMYLEGAAK